MFKFDNDEKYDVMRSAFGIARALKRGPVRMKHAFPPAVEHSLMVIYKNDGISSRELCELLDVRPSSLTELTSKMAEHGLLEKKDDEADKRLTRIFLTEKGKEAAESIEAERKAGRDELTACFTEDEAAEFCRLADKFSAHLSELNGGDEKDRGCCHGPMGGHGPHGPMHGPGHCHGHHGPHGPMPGHCHGPQGMPPFPPEVTEDNAPQL